MTLTKTRASNQVRPLRIALLLVAVASLTLAGCGNPPPDPGATRSDAQSKELRDRILQIQGRD